MFTATAPEDVEAVHLDAVHEVGHLLTFLTADIPVNYAILDNAGGQVFVDDDITPTEAFLPALMAGVVAEAMYVQHMCGVSRRDADELVKDRGCAEDMAYFDELEPRFNLSKRDATRRCERVLERRWTDLERLAELLVRKRTLTPSDY